jgi:SprT-like family
MLLAAAMVAVAGWIVWAGVTPLGRSPSAAMTAVRNLSPVDARQEQILKENAGRPGDAELVAAYRSVNARHFAGALPVAVVRWEPALADVGALAGQGFTLEGMFGLVGRDAYILLNPSLKASPRALERALCHEIVHAYLATIGDATTTHGPAFKAVLHRLSSEGAFEGIAASEAAKITLRAWLDAESARLDADQKEVAAIGAEITREREALEQEQIALRASASVGAAAATAVPAPLPVDTIEIRRDRFNQRVTEINARIERGRRSLEVFNREVERYNLMMAYPDGLDEESSMPVKTASAPDLR